MATYRAESHQALTRAAMGVIVASAIMAALFFGKEVLLPVVLAVLLSFVLSPLANGLQRLLPRGPAVAAVVIIAVALVALLGFALARQVIQLANDLPRYEVTLREKLKSFRTGAAQSSVIDKATSALKGLSQELEQPTTAQPDSSATASQRPIPVEIRQPPDRPLDIYQRIVTALMTPLTTTAIVLIMVIFILLQKADIRDRVIRLAGTRDIQLTTAALDDAASRLSRLFLVQTALNASFGVIIAIGLWIIGVPSPVLWGVFAGLMRFVPYIGAIFSAVFHILLAASVDQSWSMAIATIALFAIVEPLVGQFVEPWVQGQSTGLSPLAIVVSAVLWTTLWGPIGLLIATPVTMCLVVLGRHIEGLTFLDVILGDEPALSPAEIFYQRLLAGSSAEAAEHAEKHLKSASLLDYYGDVALPGLRLAAVDAERGALDESKMVELREGVTMLLDDLSDQPLDGTAKSKDGEAAQTADQAVLDSVPPHATAPSLLQPAFTSETPAVLCLGAKLPIDAAAADVLADLLRRHGIKARVAAISRLSDLAKLDLKDIRLVWISSTSAASAHAQIRYVARRVHRFDPTVAIFGGFWGDADRTVDWKIPGITKSADNFSSAVETTIEFASKTGEPEDSGIRHPENKTRLPTEIAAE